MAGGARCERCSAAGRGNCIEVSWDTTDRVVVRTRKQISEEEDEAEHVEAEEEELEARLKEVKERRLQHRRRIRRLRKVLKLAESRSVAQALCLEEEILAEAQASSSSHASGDIITFGPELEELANMSPSQINDLLAAPLEIDSVGSS